MNLSEPFIRRPIGTSLLALGLLLFGLVAYRFLPVAPLPRVEYPMVSVSASLPGADPATMASAVAAPLERRLGQIAGLSEMTSSSSVGSVSISMQFELDRNIDGAVRDVQAAVSAAKGDLPANLPYPPSYRKVSASDSPVMILSLSSELFTTDKLFEFADTWIAQRISQVPGISQASLSGSAKSGVRVRLNSGALSRAGISSEQVRNAILAESSYLPKGSLEGPEQSFVLNSNDLRSEAADFAGLVVGHRNGVPIRLDQVGSVIDGMENTRMAGWNGVTPAVLIAVYKQADANVIEAVDGVKAILPQLQQWLPLEVKLELVSDRTKTIRASVHDVQGSLWISVGLVVLVMLLFLRRLRPTLIASVTVPLALAGTFGGMYLLEFSLDNLSLMALSISVGFVVDDAIVVIENICRYLEEGESALGAALKGSRQIGFTVVSITLSLVAVFIPLLFMGGLIGRLLHEFAVTLSLAVLISAVISLTLTPSLCARFLNPLPTHADPERENVFQRLLEAGLQGLTRFYAITLRWALRHELLMLLLTGATLAGTFWLYGKIPKGFVPQQDTGMMMGVVEGSQDISFAAMARLQNRVAAMVLKDPGIETISSYVGGSIGGANNGRMFVALKPKEQRENVEEIIGRLRKQTAQIEGVRVFFQGLQDIRVGGRHSKAFYQYSLQSADLKELNEWSPKVLAALRALPQIRDVNSDQQTGGLKVSVRVDREAASRLGVSIAEIDAAIYNAFGQRQVATLYKRFNQHRVILELDEASVGDPQMLEQIYVRADSGVLIPLSSVARFETGNALLSVSHQGQFAAVTISFNMPPGGSLGEATDAIEQAVEDLRLPESIRGSFQGTAQVFQSSLSSLPRLILGALLAVYLVLGILYESFIHPITILSTLPSAGLGALIALYFLKCDLSLVSFIGIILLMGIVKKNAIMMVDFALEHLRTHGSRPREAIYEACLARFRPITMTTLAALFGGLPLALGDGVGFELRRPLGIAIVGGLLVSQVVTLYTTPVIYLAFERIRFGANWLWAHLKGRGGEGELRWSDPETPVVSR